MIDAVEPRRATLRIRAPVSPGYTAFLTTAVLPVRECRASQPPWLKFFDENPSKNHGVIFQEYTSGVASALPAASTAVTENVWSPSARPR